MKKLMLLLLLALSGISMSALALPGHPADSTQPYLFIVRYKPNAPKLTEGALTTYQSHWRIWIGNLAQTGKLVTGYRPATGGKTISGAGKIAKDVPYGTEEVVSSIFIIKAASPDEADSIARTCPIYESGGSVEIRPVTDMAH